MPADSLLEMARRACCRYARRIDDIGDLSYEAARPFLLKIENPDQLHTIEQRCPQIIGEDAEIWLNLIKRDIPNWDSKPHRPSNPQNWNKVYRRLKKDLQNEKAANEARLKAALSSLNTRKEENTAQVVSGRLLPKPKVSRRRQINNDNLSGRTGFQGAHKMSFLDKIRKEAREAKGARMSRPTHELVQRSAGVKKAPAGFVEDLRREKQQMRPTISPVKQHATLAVPKRPVRIPAEQPYNATEDREARLRALKAGKRPSSNIEIENNDVYRESGIEPRGGLSMRFLEDEDLDSPENSDEDLFGNVRKIKPMIAVDDTSPIAVRRKAAPQLFMTTHTPKKIKTK